VPDLNLAQGRQHGSDVVEECSVRADDQHAATSQAFTIGIEQPGRAVQTDGSLAGARSALDAQRYAYVGTDDDVLLRLDRGDDVAHGSHPWPLDLAGENLAPEGGPVRCCVLIASTEPLVLKGGQLTSVDAETPAQAHAHRLGPGRAVEGGGDVGPPVDDDGVAMGVRHVASSDVPALGRRGPRRMLVDPAEEQAGGRVVDQGLRTAVKRCRQELAGDPVAAMCFQRQRLLSHPGELGARSGQIVTVVLELGGNRHDDKCLPR